MYLGQSKIPVEVTPEMIEFYNRNQAGVTTIPGTSLKVDTQPAQATLFNTLYLVGVVGVLFYLMRSK